LAVPAQLRVEATSATVRINTFFISQLSSAIVEYRNQLEEQHARGVRSGERKSSAGARENQSRMCRMEGEQQVKTTPKEAAKAADPASYCPTCGARLKDRGCKMKCESCGFYLSCSDFY
jgi:tRNA(Ile2) C34 agmatinyltransferase TiaS